MSGFIYTKGGPTNQQKQVAEQQAPDYVAQAQEQLAPIWHNITAAGIKGLSGAAGAANLGVRAATNFIAPEFSEVLNLLQAYGESKGIPTIGESIERALTEQLPESYQATLKNPGFISNVIQRTAQAAPLAALGGGGIAALAKGIVPGAIAASTAKSLGAGETIQNLADIATTLGTAFYPGIRTRVIEKAASKQAENLIGKAHKIAQMIPYETAPLTKEFEGLHQLAKRVPEDNAAKIIEEAEHRLLGIDIKEQAAAHKAEEIKISKQRAELREKHARDIVTAEKLIQEAPELHEKAIATMEKQRKPLYDKAEHYGNKQIINAKEIDTIIHRYDDMAKELPAKYQGNAIKNISIFDSILDIPKNDEITLGKLVKGKRFLNSAIRSAGGEERTFYKKAVNEINTHIAKEAEKNPLFAKPYYEAEKLSKKMAEEFEKPLKKELVEPLVLPEKPIFELKRPEATTVSNAINAEKYLENAIQKTKNEDAIKLYNQALDRVKNVIDYGTGINEELARSYLPAKSIENSLKTKNFITQALETKTGKSILAGAPLVAPLLKFSFKLSSIAPKLAAGIAIPFTAKEVARAVDIYKSPEIRALLGQFAAQTIRKNTPAALEILKDIADMTKQQTIPKQPQQAFVFTKQ